MATWTEIAVASVDNRSLGLGRIGLTSISTAPLSWAGASIVREISLEEDEPILMALQLKAKWGL